MAMAMRTSALCLVVSACLLASAPFSSSSLSFSFPLPGSSPASLQRLLLFLGDARLSSPSIELCGSSSPNKTSGFAFFYSPIPFSPSLSFSSAFTFSILQPSSEEDRLSFVFASATPSPSLGHVAAGIQDNKSSDVGVDMEALLAAQARNASDPKGKHISNLVQEVVIFPSNVNVSGTGLLLSSSSSERLYSWVDYHAHSKLLQVRLGRLKAQGSSKLLVSQHIDLAELCQSPLYLGFGFYRVSSPCACTIHSWDFRSWDADQHSFPVEPHHFERKHVVVTGLLIASVGVACASFAAVTLRALFERAFKRKPREVPMLPIMFGYQQILADDG